MEWRALDVPLDPGRNLLSVFFVSSLLLVTCGHCLTSRASFIMISYVLYKAWTRQVIGTFFTLFGLVYGLYPGIRKSNIMTSNVFRTTCKETLSFCGFHCVSQGYLIIRLRPELRLWGADVSSLQALVHSLGSRRYYSLMLLRSEISTAGTAEKRNNP